MNYRLGRKGDEPQILEIVKCALEVYGLQLEVEGADRDVTDLEMHYLQAGGWFEVVEEKDRIVGSVGLFRVDHETCELRKMYILPQYQGRGIGKQLMAHAFAAADELGFKRMTLQTSSKLVKALPLYEQYGFEMIEEEVCERCDIAMQKTL